MRYGTTPVTLLQIGCGVCGEPVHDGEWDKPLIVAEEHLASSLGSPSYVEEWLRATVIDDVLVCHRHETHWCERTDAIALGTFTECGCDQ